MARRPLPSQDRDSIPVSQLPRLMEGWISDGQYRRLSTATLTARRSVLTKLAWWIDQQSPQPPDIGRMELRGFLGYLASGQPRWGIDHPNAVRSVRPSTSQTYHRILRTFFAWLVEEGTIEVSPMETLKAPVVRQDQIRPFTPAQIHQLLAAAKAGRHAKRDTALILFLLDTGARACEVVGMSMADLNLEGGYADVLGKGNKRRRVCFSPMTRKAIASYLREHGREPTDAVWLAEGGWERGEGLKRDGLTQLITRLGQNAGIEGVRCSPHTFRHTFAKTFLQSGGNMATLMELLGHTSTTMSKRYVAIFAEDAAEAHQRYSPVLAMLGKEKKGK